VLGNLLEDLTKYTFLQNLSEAFVILNLKIPRPNRW